MALGFCLFVRFPLMFVFLWNLYSTLGSFIDICTVVAALQQRILQMKAISVMI